LKRPATALVVAVALALGFPGRTDQASVSWNAGANRALSAFSAMQRFFYHKSTGLYASAYPAPPKEKASTLWPFSQALAATVSVAQLDPRRSFAQVAIRDRLRGLGRYWNARLRPQGYEAIIGAAGEQYYDDNAWVGLELVRINVLTGNRFALRRAIRLFDLLASGWDTTSTHPCPGGVFWTRKPQIRHRNTVSTANAAQLAVALYQRTHRIRYVTWAKTMYKWVNRCLTASNRLFADHIDLTGRVDAAQWSYNQGAMIAAGVRLFQATRDPAYLEQAEQVADDAIHAYEPYDSTTEPPYFLAIFFDDVALLDRVDRDRVYTDAVRTYANAVAATALDPRTGLVRFKRGRPVQLLEQAALVRVYASLAATP
jgi:predicted alpha-1,6-mannanase (GH76 family)